MDQPSLSLKLFKKQQSKTKEQTLLLKKRRKDKRKGKVYLDIDLPIKTKRGQIVIETLFVLIGLTAFLLAVQFFQSLVREEIQKQRLSKEKFYKRKPPKAPWYRHKDKL